MDAVIDAEVSKNTIGRDPQKLNERTCSKFVSRNREDQITEATLEHPHEITREYWESSYMQRTVHFQFMPPWAVYGNIDPPAVPTRNKVGFNPEP